MAWHFEVRGPGGNLLLFGGGHTTRAEAEKAVQTAKKKWSSRNLENLLQIRIGVSD
jgi:hypothetical protein